MRRFARRTDYAILRLSGDRFLPVEDLHTDCDDEVPSNLLFPQERDGELGELLR